MATIRDVAARILSGGPLTVSALARAIQSKVPAAVVWDEGVRHLLEQDHETFRLVGSDTWELRNKNADDGCPPPSEQFEDLAFRDLATEPVYRLGFVGEDSTEYVRYIVLATEPHSVHEQRDLARRRDLALALGDEHGARQVCWTLAWGSMRLGMWVAERYRPTGMERCDLISASLNGLFRASEKWNPDMGAFSTYATLWARQAVARYLAEASRLIELPAHAHDAWLKIRKFVMTYSETHDAPSNQTIADALGIAPQFVAQVLRASADYTELGRLHEALRVLEEADERSLAGGPDRLDDEIGLEEARALIGRGWLEPHEEYESTSDVKDLVSAALTDLDERSRDIIKRRFGFFGGREQTLEEIGSVYGVTRERIRQLESKAIDAIAPELSRRLGRDQPPPRTKQRGPVALAALTG